MKPLMSRFSERLNRLRRSSPAADSQGEIGRRLTATASLVKEKLTGKQPPQNGDATLRISRYNLVLMDNQGQVVWGREFDAGGSFEFRPGHRLYIACEYTNRSAREAEVAEFEIELAGDDGSVVSRFGESFGDAVVVAPGESKQFIGEWRL
jgi:hypothetical protein